MNLEKETRRGYEISAEMKKVWAVEMELLKKLLEVCERNNLKIWAEGGTLLGAVREKGYIPWDDDIDMAMPREDYDKLRSIANKEFQAPYFFQCGYTDLYPHGQTKIRKNGTSAILKGDIFQKFHQGIFIDIFPLDSLPNDMSIYKDYKKTRGQMKKNLELYCKHYYSFSDWKHNINTLKVLLFIKKIGFNKYFRQYDEFVKSYSKEDCDRVSIISWNGEEKYIRLKKWYSETTFLPFEDTMIPVPTNYHDILSKQYGDYLTPSIEPNQHGGFAVLDPNNDYKAVLPLLKKEHRWDMLKARWKNLKAH